MACTAFLIFCGQIVAQTLTTLYTFPFDTGGPFPGAGVAIGAGGMLYGATEGGGTHDNGTLFSLTPPAAPGGAWTEAILYSFAKSFDGAPGGGLTIGPGGALYGIAAADATVFALYPPRSPGGVWSGAGIYKFSDSSVGSYPFGNVAIGRGALYGVALYGGINNCLNGDPGCGTVFSLAPPAGQVSEPGAQWTGTAIHEFAGGAGDGSDPSAGVIIGSDGTLYGTTMFGGSAPCTLPFGEHGCGIVFSLTPPAVQGGAWTETVLHNFAGSPSDGSYTAAPLVAGRDAAGQVVLYGATPSGGTGSCNYYSQLGCGTVFSLTQPTSPGGAWAESVLHSFQGGSDGSYPGGALAIGPDGTLYGATFYGGTGPCIYADTGCGTLFSLAPPASPGGAWTETVLYAFTADSHGAYPTGSLVFAPDGLLYGMTGGSAGLPVYGTLFSLRP